MLHSWTLEIAALLVDARASRVGPSQEPDLVFPPGCVAHVPECGSTHASQPRQFNCYSSAFSTGWTEPL